MFEKVVKELKVILSQKFNIIHFIISLVMTSILVYGLSILSVVLG